MSAAQRAAKLRAASNPMSPIRRLPIAEAMSILRTGEASIILSSDVKSLRIRYNPTDDGTREFMSRFAPQLAYANPAIPISLERRPDSRNASRRSDPTKPLKGATDTKLETEVTVNFHTRSADTRKYWHSTASQILQAVLEVSGSAISRITAEKQAMIEGPTSSAAAVEGIEGAVGVSEEPANEVKSDAATSGIDEFQGATPVPRTSRRSENAAGIGEEASDRKSTRLNSSH
ncbi:MAG: hypothetical protein TREMPRED_004773, partial [Tremellales sp. Tagirdzhanova-0007]